MLSVAEREFVRAFADTMGGSVAETMVRAAWPHHKAPYRDAGPTAVAANPVLQAEVNHGRWIVRCPYCAGAQLASFVDQRFFCVECLHSGTAAERRWLKVAWPADPDEVDRVLSCRPEATNMNFDPRTETVMDLIRENELHGVA